MMGVRVLRIIGAVEMLTLVLMLGNLATIHARPITSALGPIHGLAYVGAVITAMLIMNGRHRIWLLALIPGLGGILAGRAATRRESAAGVGA